jgi:hypothetical protein
VRPGNFSLAGAELRFTVPPGFTLASGGPGFTLEPPSLVWDATNSSLLRKKFNVTLSALGASRPKSQDLRLEDVYSTDLQWAGVRPSVNSIQVHIHNAMMRTYIQTRTHTHKHTHTHTHTHTYTHTHRDTHTHTHTQTQAHTHTRTHTHTHTHTHTYTGDLLADWLYCGFQHRAVSVAERECELHHTFERRADG